MTSTNPPKAAKWLLSHFGCSPNNDAVIGDLDERYRESHSRAWYWGQVMKAVFASIFQEVRTQRMLAFRALLTGWTLLFIAAFLFRSIIVALFWSAIPQAPAIRHAADLHPYAALTVLIAIGCVEWTGIGWLLNHLYHEKAIVLAFAETVLAVSAAIMLIIGFMAHVHPIWMGMAGNLAGLFFLLIGAGLLNNPAQRPTRPS